MLLPVQRRLAQQVKNARTILATDLDGTFVGGSEEDRAALYDYLRNKPHTALIFVTGRDQSHVRHLIDNEGLPRPHFIICDVGTCVIDGHDFEPVVQIEAWIESHWLGHGQAHAALKCHEHHLTLQEVFGRRRLSYFISDLDQAYQAKAAVEDVGYDGIVSADTFFDVLPRGIHKGSTLLKLIDMLGIDDRKVLAAGDTLNDLSLFHTGLKCVAVANREPDLDKALPNVDHILRAYNEGAGGILEALRHFDLYISKETSE